MFTEAQEAFLKAHFIQTNNDRFIQDLAYLKGVGGKKGTQKMVKFLIA